MYYNNALYSTYMCIKPKKGKGNAQCRVVTAARRYSGRKEQAVVLATSMVEGSQKPAESGAGAGSCGQPRPGQEGARDSAFLRLSSKRQLIWGTSLNRKDTAITCRCWLSTRNAGA